MESFKLHLPSSHENPFQGHWARPQVIVVVLLGLGCGQNSLVNNPQHCNSFLKGRNRDLKRIQEPGLLVSGPTMLPKAEHVNEYVADSGEPLAVRGSLITAFFRRPVGCPPFIYILCVCMFLPHVMYVCVPHMCSTHRGQMRVSGSLELESQML